jgi:DNA polymerase-3 subunit gamma/tau
LAYQVLARRWRPQRFDDLVGQEHVTRTLSNAIKTGRLAHAFLFCGPRGVGKTSAARILAKCLNCEKAKDGPIPDPCNECGSCAEIAAGRSLDVLEIDGASNRGIDEIRDLRENVRYAPSQGRAKVYIIDEVHMLTKEAFNALLKTLEEPPPAVYFVFATTEAHRVPATIRSRCQKYDFHRIPAELIVETLEKLAKKEKFKVEPAALAELARQADGGLRDAQSLLDQAAAVGDGKVTLEGLRQLLGEAEGEAYLRIVERTAGGDAGGAFSELQELLDRGMDPGRVALDLTQTLRDLLVARAAPKSAVALGVRPDLLEELSRIAAAVPEAKLTAMLALASRTAADLRRSSRPRLTLEVALARMSRLEDPGDLAQIAERLEALQGQVGGGPPAGGSGGGGGGAGGPAGRVPSPAQARAAARSSSPEKRSPGRGRGSGGPRAEAEETAPRAEPSAPAPQAAAEYRDEEPAAAVATAEAPPADGPAGELWPDLLRRVRGRKMMLASFLEHGAPAALDEESLTVVFDNNYYEGMVSRRENVAILREELKAATGKPLEFRARMGAVPGRRAPAEEAPRRSSGRDLLDDNPGLRRAVHDLGGHVLPEAGGDG